MAQGTVINAGAVTENVSQADFEISPYQDADWEVVGELRITSEFSPLEVAAIESAARYVDPMFADYGGIASSTGKVRWHLPEALLHRQAAAAGEEERPAEPTTTLRESEYQAALQDAFEKGRQAGRAAAEQEGAQKYAAVEQRLGGVLADLQKQLGLQSAEHEKQCIALALEIARRIIDTAVEINPEYIVPVIHEAVKLSGTAAIKAVRVSPQDLEFIELVGLAKSLKEYDGSWQFKGDATIKAGCVVETSAGEIDYQLDKAWERIRDRVVRIAR